MALSPGPPGRTYRGGAIVSLSRSTFEAIVLGQRTLEDAVTKRDATVTGDRDRTNRFFTLFDDFDANFPIVEPRRIQ